MHSLRISYGHTRYQVNLVSCVREVLLWERTASCAQHHQFASRTPMLRCFACFFRGIRCIRPLLPRNCPVTVSFHRGFLVYSQGGRYRTMLPLGVFSRLPAPPPTTNRKKYCFSAWGVHLEAQGCLLVKFGPMWCVLPPSPLYAGSKYFTTQVYVT